MDPSPGVTGHSVRVLDPLVRRGLRLEYATLAWNVVGVPLLAVAAIRSGSAAAAGFGLDSAIEIGASLVVVWELNGQGGHRERTALRLIGDVLTQGLATVLAAEPFRRLGRHNVDSNPTCRQCELRYLCGGACRAWGGAATQVDLDAPPPECAGLKARADGLLAAARSYIMG